MFLDCSTEPLGMQNGKINNSAITSPSNSAPTVRAWQARLNRNIPTWGAWCPNQTDSPKGPMIFKKYIQIDLSTLKMITKVATQGREYNNGREHTKIYRISYSDDDHFWQHYKTENGEKVMYANTDIREF